MRYLLDSNIVIWLLEEPTRIKAPVMDVLLDPSSELLVSTASLLEIVSKAASGRLTFEEEARGKIEAVSKWLPVQEHHAWRVRSLPVLHKDPFDRILVAQAIEESLTLVTGDHRLADYGVPVLLT